MEEAFSAPAAVPRTYWRPVMMTSAVAVLAVMGWIWWTFYALNQAQTYRVLHVAGQVQIRSPGGSTHPETLADGTVIETGASGFATLAFSDGSSVKILPNTRARITTAKSNARGDRHEMAVGLDVGELTSRILHKDGGARRVSVTTKAVNIAVRGTIFALIQDSDDARLTVTGGRVSAAGATGSEVTVAKNMGTVIRAGEAPLTPVQLAPPPRLDSVVAAGADAPEGLEFRWQPVPGINLWQLEIARDEAFTKPIARHRAADIVVTVPPLGRDGRFFWRVASLDSLGLRGPWSQATPFEHDYYYHKGRQALLNLNPDDAVAFFKNAQGSYDAELELMRKRGWTLLRQGEMQKARRQFETVVAVRGNDSSAEYGLGVVEISGNDLAAAEKQFDAVLRSDPDNVDARVGLAVVAVRSGRFDDGLRQSRAALEIDPASVPALQIASMAAVGVGDHKLASSFVQKILSTDSKNPTALALSQTLDPADGVKKSLSDVKGSVLSVKPAE